MNQDLSRRQWLGLAGGSLIAGTAAAAAPPPAQEAFRLSFNTSTIMGQKLKLVEVVDITAKAGYPVIEPWVRELDQHVKDGGSLKDVGKRIRDHGMTVESAIGFAEWIVDDDARRQKGLEQAKRDMDMVQQIGGKRIAAPPVGATNQTDLNLMKASERYAALVEVGMSMGVTPQVELWGFSKSLSRLGETMLVALECGHPQACILADVYHLYKGGSNFTGLKLLGPQSMHVFHLNDYPAMSRGEITDAHRVYPGDGVAPLKQMLRELQQIGFRGVLSLELFNRDYWKQDPFLVARTGLEKMKALIASV